MGNQAGVPTTVEEIFEISNRNRKKNKLKKKCKDADKKEAGETVASIIRSQHLKDDKENELSDFKELQKTTDKEFMRYQLGWDVVTPKKNQRQDSGKKSSSKLNHPKPPLSSHKQSSGLASNNHPQYVPKSCNAKKT